MFLRSVPRQWDVPGRARKGPGGALNPDLFLYFPTMRDETVLPGYCGASAGHPLHGPYHDHEYGFPVRDDDRLFERLVLEINQAGLSWLTILKKRASFRRAYREFRVSEVAAFGADDRTRLLLDPGIVRNRLKVDAAISNARTLLRLKDSHGSFAAWLDHHHPMTRSEWVRLFKKTFRFTGGEITGEFLISTGYLPGAHAPECPVHQQILEMSPPWLLSEPRRGE
jgi:DNA-3-methyladenine glycosylase I